MRQGGRCWRFVKAWYAEAERTKEGRASAAAEEAEEAILNNLLKYDNRFRLRANV